MVILSIAIIGFALDKSVISTKYSGLKWMYGVAFISAVITTVCLYINNHYTEYPLWVLDFLRQLYFVSSPILAPFYLVYGMSIVHNKLSYSEFFRRFFWVLIPYIIYLLFVFSNPIHNFIFTVTPELGYIKGASVRVSYYIAFVYFIILLLFTLKYRKTPQRNVLLMICLNFLLSTCVFSFQLLVPEVQLSGLSYVCGLLMVHLYVLSVSKSRDALTELSNRQKLTLQLTQHCNKNTHFSLVVFSLRNFKSINERFGLNIGDAILSDLSVRLRTMLPQKYLYRYGGDEFAYIYIGEQQDSLNAFLHNTVKAICTPFEYEETRITIDMVYARVDFPAFGNSVKEIISAMDYSISSVKKNVGETNFFYDSTICNRMKRRHHIIERLKHAINHDGFEVHYQAIYSSEQKNFPMAEALVRLKPSEEAPISPGEFIPIAEETGLVGRITYIVLEKICQDLCHLSNLYADDISPQSISINFPYVLFLQKDTVHEVTEMIDRYKIPHGKIKMELTERTLVSDIDTVRNVMDNFIACGFEFELDDFGVEYSNLSLFFDIPIKIVKFDRSLVYSVTSDDTRRHFFEHFMEAVKAVDIQVVMEGVEEQELLNYLTRCKCDYIQGYVFTKPLPRDEFAAFLEKHNAQM